MSVLQPLLRFLAQVVTCAAKLSFHSILKRTCLRRLRIGGRDPQH